MRKLPHSVAAVVGTAIWLSLSHLTFAADPNPDQIIKKHLDSLGTPDARAAIRSRLVEGVAQYKLLVGGIGQATGKASLASTGRKVRLILEFPSNESRDERFVYDGTKVTVAESFSSSPPSFGEFLQSEDIILKQGFLGGVLSTAWPLFNHEEIRSKLAYEGLRKIDGRKLHTFRYRTTDSALEMRLYFDCETYYHVLTSYTLSIPPGYRPGISLRPRSGQNQLPVPSQQSHYKFEERFADFKTVDGLTLPTHYDLRFIQLAADGGNTEKEWRVSVTNVSTNVTLDQATFK